MPDFWHLPINPILKIQKFPLSILILGKNLSNFLYPTWKLDNPYCHISHQRKPNSRFAPGAKRVSELLTKTDKYFLFKLNKSPISLIAVELEILLQHVLWHFYSLIKGRSLTTALETGCRIAAQKNLVRGFQNLGDDLFL